jgi:hypothetical protein
VFVRLSTRSPKDAVDKIDPKILIPILRKHLTRLRAATAAAQQQPQPPATTTTTATTNTTTSGGVAVDAADVKVSVPAASAATDSKDDKSSTAVTGDTATLKTATKLANDDLNLQFLALRYTFFDVLAVSDADAVLQIMSLSSRVVSDVSRALTATTFMFGDDDVPTSAPTTAVTAPAATTTATAPATAPVNAPVSVIAPATSTATDEKSAAAVTSIPASVPSSHWNLKFIVREFVQLPIEGEFRGFVSEKKLTSLSQYYCDVVFPGLFGARATAIGERVLKFFNTTIVNLIPIGK